MSVVVVCDQFSYTHTKFLQHAHYVAASRVTTLGGLQIISWKPERISVNQDVKEHMDYLETHRKVQLCYTPVNNMVTSMKCCFLNTRSLYKHIENVKANHNMCVSGVIFLAKTRLIHSDEVETYKITGYEVLCRNDQLWNQTPRPPHGLISYVRDTFWILGHETQTSQNYDLCVQHRYLPIPVQLISIYLSPQCPYVYFTKTFDEFMKNYYDVT